MILRQPTPPEGLTMRTILCVAVATIAVLYIPTASSLSCPPCLLSVCDSPKCCESGSFVKVTTNINAVTVSVFLENEIYGQAWLFANAL